MAADLWRKIAGKANGNTNLDLSRRLARQRKDQQIFEAQAMLAAPFDGDTSLSARSSQSNNADNNADNTDNRVRAYQAALKQLEKNRRSPQRGAVDKSDLIRTAQAIHRGRQSVFKDLDPYTRENLQRLALTVFGLKD